MQVVALPLTRRPILVDEITHARFVGFQRGGAIETELAENVGKRDDVHGYGTLTGTTLMLLNGEPLISFVLMTV